MALATVLRSQAARATQTTRRRSLLVSVLILLAVFTATEFEALRKRLAKASTTNDAVQGLQRLINGMATPCNFDRQGRILIPPKLREWAFLEREIVFTGVGSRIELWDRSRHAAELERVRQHYPDLAREVKEFGL